MTVYGDLDALSITVNSHSKRAANDRYLQFSQLGLQIRPRKNLRLCVCKAGLPVFTRPDL